MSEPSISAALSAAGRILRGRPGDVFPAYLLATGVTTVVQAPVLLALGGAVATLAVTGRVDPLLRALDAAREAGEGTDAPADPTAAAGAADAAREALRDAATPEVVGLLGAGVVVALLVGLAVRPVAVAVTQSTVWAVLDGGDDPLVRGVRGAGRWRTFLGLLLVRLAVGVVLVGLPLAGGVVLADASSVAGVLLLLVALAGGLVFLLVSGLLVFAGPAAVVDRVGTVRAVLGSLAFVRRNVGVAVALLAVVAGLYVGAGVLVGFAGLVGVPRVGGLLVPFVVSPVVDLAATGLYAGVRAPDDAPTRPADDPGSADDSAAADHRSGRRDDDSRSTTASDPSGGEPRPTDETHAATEDDSDDGDRVADGGEPAGDDDPQTATRTSDADTDSGTGPEPPSPAVWPTRDRPSVRQTLRDGLRAVGGVIRDGPLATLGGLLVFCLGVGGGWAVTAPSGVRFDPPTDPGAVFGAVPVDVFLNIAANNWLVAVAGTYGGLAFGVPAAVSAGFNGAIVGGIAGVYDPVGFLALVAPHGVLEVPTLVVAWGLGLHLGGVGWRAVRGRTDAATVAAELRRAARALVGIGVLLVVASGIEAFLTPRIAAFVL